MGTKAIGQGIKTRLKTIGDIAQVFAPDEIPDTLNAFPVAVILPGETTYHTAFNDEYQAMFRILILLGKPDLPSALSRILDYADTTGDDSVFAAIYGDKTLDGSCSDCVLQRNSGAGYTTWGNIQYLSTEFALWCI